MTLRQCCSIIAAVVAMAVVCRADELASVEASLVASYTTLANCRWHCTDAVNNAKSLTAAGSWSDLSYTSGSANVWSAATHWTRMVTMVRAGASGGMRFAVRDPGKTVCSCVRL